MHASKPPATAEKVPGPPRPDMLRLFFLFGSQQAAHVTADAVSCLVYGYAVVDEALKLVVLSSGDSNKSGVHEISIRLSWRVRGDTGLRDLAHKVWHQDVGVRKRTEPCVHRHRKGAVTLLGFQCHRPHGRAHACVKRQAVVFGQNEQQGPLGGSVVYAVAYVDVSAKPCKGDPPLNHARKHGVLGSWYSKYEYNTNS